MIPIPSSCRRRGPPEIADEIGLDLYNGRIEILCNETLRPYDPAADVGTPVEEAFATSKTSRLVTSQNRTQR